MCKVCSFCPKYLRESFLRKSCIEIAQNAQVPKLRNFWDACQRVARVLKGDCSQKGNIMDKDTLKAVTDLEIHEIIEMFDTGIFDEIVCGYVMLTVERAHIPDHEGQEIKRVLCSLLDEKSAGDALLVGISG